jgi:nucleotide-binding universal stress UspA family protein
VFEQQAREAVEQLGELAADSAITFHSAVERGLPHETILSYADENDIDLISMGTHGRTGLDRVLLGSVTERVVRTSEIPVLTARFEPDETSEYDRILIPTDGSEAATAAIEHGIAIAERFDATVHALSVVDINVVAGAHDAGPGLPTLFESLEKGAERAVSVVEDECEDRDVTTETAVLKGVPYRAIQEYVADEGIDLISMGTHGRSGLERYLLGSVTERTVRSSEVPVLTVTQRT